MKTWPRKILTVCLVHLGICTLFSKDPIPNCNIPDAEYRILVAIKKLPEMDRFQRDREAYAKEVWLKAAVLALHHLHQILEESETNLCDLVVCADLIDKFDNLLPEEQNSSAEARYLLGDTKTAYKFANDNDLKTFLKYQSSLHDNDPQFDQKIKELIRKDNFKIFQSIHLKQFKIKLANYFNQEILESNEFLLHGNCPKGFPSNLLTPASGAVDRYLKAWVDAWRMGEISVVQQLINVKDYYVHYSSSDQLESSIQSLIPENPDILYKFIPILESIPTSVCPSIQYEIKTRKDLLVSAKLAKIGVVYYSPDLVKHLIYPRDFFEALPIALVSKNEQLLEKIIANESQLLNYRPNDVLASNMENLTSQLHSSYEEARSDREKQERETQAENLRLQAAQETENKRLKAAQEEETKRLQAAEQAEREATDYERNLPFDAFVKYLIISKYKSKLASIKGRRFRVAEGIESTDILQELINRIPKDQLEMGASMYKWIEGYDGSTTEQALSKCRTLIGKYYLMRIGVFEIQGDRDYPIDGLNEFNVFGQERYTDTLIASINVVCRSTDKVPRYKAAAILGKLAGFRLAKNKVGRTIIVPVVDVLCVAAVMPYMNNNGKAEIVINGKW